MTPKIPNAAADDATERPTDAGSDPPRRIAYAHLLPELPKDADGDALRRLAATGSDLAGEMEIDFAVLVPDRDTGEQFASEARRLGFTTKVSFYIETNSYTCYCTCTMMPAYERIIATQELLGEAGAPFGAAPDGWGSFGNSEAPIKDIP